MTTTDTRTKDGAPGKSGALGADSTSVTQTSGDGGDGTDGGSAGNASYSRTAIWSAANSLTLTVLGGSGGVGGDGNYAGQAFVLADHKTDGSVATWHDTYSDAGNGGDGGNGGNAGNADLTVAALTAGSGLTLAAQGGLGSWGGNGFQGGQGGNTYVEHLSNWETVDNVVISRDWTVDASAGGLSGHGGNSGNGGAATVSLKDSTVHGKVSISAQGTLSTSGGSGAAGTGGTVPHPGADGGDGGQGGDATIVVDHTAFDFNAEIKLTSQSGSGGFGGAGGYGGYSDNSTRNDDVSTHNYTFATGGNGGDGGDGGNVNLTVTDSTFTGTGGDDLLVLQLFLSTGSHGGGGRGGLGGLDGGDAYSGQAGSEGVVGTANLVFNGNDIDGGAGVDTFRLYLTNTSFERTANGDGLRGLGTVTIDLEHGTMTVGGGTNTIENVENVDLYYQNSFQDLAGQYHYSASAVVIGDNADNTIRGTLGNDSLSGGGGDDILDGISGLDVLYGGGGNDTYGYYRGQTVLEYANGGIDTLDALGSANLMDNVENLNLTSHGNVYGVGNSLDNIITGGRGNNVLSGMDGNDTLIGGAGSDVMYGGKGDDIAIVSNAGDVMREYGDQGFDIVRSSVSYTLGRNVEELILTGKANLAGRGSSDNNVIYGNSGKNWLNGGGGNDVLNGMGGTDALTGGDGADTFKLTQGGGHDTVRDFSAAQGDRIFVHAYSEGVTLGAGITIHQEGNDAVIDFGGGNWVTVLNTQATDSAFLSHIVW